MASFLQNEAVKIAFNDALRLPRDKWATYLEESLLVESDLAEVRRLLACHGPDNLDAPAAEPGSDFASIAVGCRIGEYEIIRELGRGGMGIVYLARRVDDLYEKNVAIKVVHTDDGEEFFRRVHVETQILASLSHRYIVSLLDAGTMDEDAVYLVMEYVNGRKVDVYCREAGLDIRARLSLFLKICEAVEYAHRSLVIHRDLVPSNILVTEDGTPKLLDFGLAELLRDVEEPLTTSSRWRMTLRYASPERVRGESRLTTTTDIYSLGVVLYELLTGASPYGSATDSMAVMRAILDADPTRPRDLEPLLPKDLEAIVLKCLSKEPERRYLSVEGMREDIERFQSGMPVFAHSDSRLYRAGKFVRRNRLALGAVGAAAVMVGSLAAMTLYEWRRAERHMENELAVTTETLKVAAGLTWGLPGAAEANYVIREASTRHQRGLVDERPGDWGLKRELLQSYFQLLASQGDPETPLHMGRTEEAYRTCRQALALAEEIAGHDQNPQAQLSLSHALNYLSKLAIEVGKAEEAELSLTRALGLNRDVKGEDEVTVDRRWVYTHSLMLLARGRAARGEAGAAALSGEAVHLREGWVQLPPAGPPKVRRAMAIALRTHGEVLLALLRFKEAIPSLEKAADLEQQGLAEVTTPDVVTPYHLATAQEDLGRALTGTGNLREARHLIDESLRRYRQIAKENFQSPMASRYVARGLDALAQVCERTGDPKGALEALNEELTMLEAAVRNDAASMSAGAALNRCRADIEHLRLRWHTNPT